MRIFPFIAAAIILSPLGVWANPNGAPWGSSNPDGVVHCASCHFDGEPVRDSQSILLDGLPDMVAPGVVYDLVLTFTKPEEAAVAGFLASSNAGAFQSENELLETKSKEIRSIKPLQEDTATWNMRWRAPDSDVQAIKFYFAVNAGNDDQSAFGDEIHYRSFEIEARE